MERARWNTELSYKKLNFESVQLLGFTPIRLQALLRLSCSYFTKKARLYLQS
jgi:hypothetical protein